MMFSIFNLLSSVDPQTQQLLNNLMEVLLPPILYAIGGCGLAFSTIKYAFKIHSDPENKGEYLRHMVWSVLGVGHAIWSLLYLVQWIRWCNYLFIWSKKCW